MIKSESIYLEEVKKSNELLFYENSIYSEEFYLFLYKVCVGLKNNMSK